ncbi:hypothetical protein EKO27_g9990 [Xylaria grammica]|uniref:ABM domain-containing protein n=1 Tax=Xylaria grammica TaxID=363999 RepID=A0A439CSF3_9PEZI|nr:hypothetical protein EKO27_g9990 [Xylaria grammica]
MAMSSGRISSWTRFRLPSSESLEPSIFRPLAVGSNNHIHDAYYGRITELSDEYILVVIWESRQDYEQFKDTVQYRELLANLHANLSSSPELATQIIDFDRIAFWWRFGPNTELRTVYFPALLSVEARETVKSLKGLVLTMGVGIDGSKAHLSPYRGVPTCGWVDGLQSWMDQETISCVWCHYWKDQRAEEKFKTTETRPPKDGEEDKLLAVEAFEKDLKGLGALGWEDIHVDFKRLPKSV